MFTNVKKALCPFCFDSHTLLLCISCSCAAPVARLKTFSIYYNVSSRGGLHDYLPQALSNYPNHLPASLPQIGGTLTPLCSALETAFKPWGHNTLHAALKTSAELLTRSSARRKHYAG